MEEKGTRGRKPAGGKQSSRLRVGGSPMRGGPFKLELLLGRLESERKQGVPRSRVHRAV